MPFGNSRYFLNHSLRALAKSATSSHPRRPHNTPHNAINSMSIIRCFLFTSERGSGRHEKVSKKGPDCIGICCFSNIAIEDNINPFKTKYNREFALNQSIVCVCPGYPFAISTARQNRQIL